LVVWTDGEITATLAVCYRKDGVAITMLTKWVIDSDITYERYLCSNEEAWDQAWEKFLDLIPESVAPAVAHSEMTVKY
jgi:hypothetical protein